MNDRFRWIDNWKEPKLFYERLYEPDRLKKPSTVLVGSMCDLFGGWVPEFWIEEVLRAISHSDQHSFLLLTKNPKRYKSFTLPNNCLPGVTITGHNDLDKVSYIETLQKYWISFEPLLGVPDMYYHILNPPCWIVIGALTGNKYGTTMFMEKAIERIISFADAYMIPVFMKNNLRKFWNSEWRREKYGKRIM